MALDNRVAQSSSSMAIDARQHEHIMPFGTQIQQAGGVLFRLWAPSAHSVDLCLLDDMGGQQCFPMVRRPDGFFERVESSASPGSLYQFRINSDLLVPDPVSRGQYEDIHGPSVVVDPADFEWKNTTWSGRPWEEAVIYEIHPGTFSPTGNFYGITEQLPYLADLGITAIELMPVADFPGRYNWGYDGALLFAPDTAYGSPPDLKHLVDTAHSYGLMVFLDVVYNHFGPEGNYLYVYAKEPFFTEKFHTPWGAALNFSGEESRTVRDFFINNALYWLNEYRFDGLRFDAVHAIFDDSQPDILEEIAAAIREGPGKTRYIHLILENDKNQANYLARDGDNCPSHFVAQWNDDLHHACHSLLTGEKNGYYIDYADEPIRHLGRCLSEGFAYQGEPSIYRNQIMRGEESGHLPPQAFVSFLQNHDQVGNRAFGERLATLVPEHLLRITTALVLLAPSPPLLFMGEEFGATTPFLFFCNFGPDLSGKISEGRRSEFACFPEFSNPALLETIPDPEEIATYHRSFLDWQERENDRGQRFHSLYSQLLALRRHAIIPRLSGMHGDQARYRILGQDALEVSWLLGDGATLWVVVNFGSRPAEPGTAHNGRLFYSEPSSQVKSYQHRAIEPYSIRWFLENDKRSKEHIMNVKGT